MLTPTQTHLLASLLERQLILFVGSTLGPQILSDNDKKILEDNGIDLSKIYSQKDDLVTNNFILGMLSNILGEQRTKNMYYDELIKYIESGQHIPLNQKEIATINSLKMQSLTDIKSANGKIFSDINRVVGNEMSTAKANQEEFIREQVIEGLSKRQSFKTIARELGRLTGDWARNFQKSVQYISHTALNEGRAAMIERRYGNNEEAKMYFSVHIDACGKCKELYLNSDSSPRIFTLKQLQANGSNIGRKQNEWKATLSALHPNCLTSESRIFTEEGVLTIKELFDLQEPLKLVVDGRVRNRVLGDQKGDVWFYRHGSGSTLKNASCAFDTGIQECFLITLRSGHQIEVSAGHDMWVDNGKSGKKIKASDLKVGDKVPILSGAGAFGKDHFPVAAELMGNLMGDGSIHENTAIWNFFGEEIEYGKRLNTKAMHLSSGMGKGNHHSRIKDKAKIYPPDNKYNVNRFCFNSIMLGEHFVNDFKLSKKPRRVIDRLWRADKETVAAFLRGLFSADGHSEKSYIVLAQNDFKFLQEIQILLSNFGLVSRIHKHGDAVAKKITYSNGDQFNTNRKACWRLMIGGIRQCRIFANEIGFGQICKHNKLLLMISVAKESAKKNNWRTAHISSIESIGLQQTYCVQEIATNTITINGIVTGNCRCTIHEHIQGQVWQDHKFVWPQGEYKSPLNREKIRIVFNGVEHFV